MTGNKKIKTALVSVFYKDGLDQILKVLNDNGVKFLSTGGTQAFIQSLGYECEAVEDLTGYPSILCGRVKTYGIISLILCAVRYFFVIAVNAGRGSKYKMLYTFFSVIIGMSAGLKNIIKAYQICFNIYIGIGD